MFRDKLYLVDYDESWPSKFEEGRNILLKTIGHYIYSVEHVGGTSVPGLGAKPIIDIGVELHSLAEESEFIPLLQKAGYRYVEKWNIILPFRRYFVRHLNNDHENISIEHLHMVERGHKFHFRHLLFRDYLRSHPKAREEYYQLKLKLVASSIPRENYSDAKSDFIRSIEKLAYNEKFKRDPPVDYFTYS